MLETLAHIALSLAALIAPLALAWYLLGRGTPQAGPRRGLVRPAAQADKTPRKTAP